MHITITHSASEGTIARGDTREAKEILKRLGFRWSSNCGFWFRIKSRGTAKPTLNLDWAKKCLEEGGFSVSVSVEECTEEEARQAKIEALLESAERAENRAEKAEEKSEAAYSNFKAISDCIPLGQPILVGHHSEKRHRRDIEKIDRALEVSATESSKAEYLESKAERLRYQAEVLSKAEEKSSSFDLALAEVSKLKKALGASSFKKTASGKGLRRWAIFWIKIKEVCFQGYLNDEGFSIDLASRANNDYIAFGENFVERVVENFQKKFPK